MIGWNDRDQTDTHIKCAVHLELLDLTEFRDHIENREFGPSAFLDLNRGSLRENSWNVLEETAAGDVGQTLEINS